ncbi:VOC family protein [Brevibacillus ruminantium]|uniref:VOC family protein n=1 Tax=Brevibacillus ruminantium TaxID=2950604 RepID=A0ABY4WC90_9BACL|nr:VOC family protein [Brevibacillus ruminantium]USG64806.1 VOC family protein [Brevibacillus ruminantium]
MTHFVSHIATVEIPVSHVQKSVEWYTDIFGLNVHFQDQNSAMLTFGAKGVPTIYLVETKEQQGLSFRNTNNDVVHSVIDFYTPSLTDFYQWLQEKHVDVGPLNIHPEHGYGGFGFKDPDGNLLSATNILHPGQ